MVSAGTSLPEVFFDFWKAVSNAVDEHRATGQDRSFRKVVMFVAPFCEVTHTKASYYLYIFLRGDRHNPTRKTKQGS